MAKGIAILNTIAWGAFWAFGLLALSTPPQDANAMMLASVLAALGGLIGLSSFTFLVRHSEATGYATPRNRVV